MLQMQVGLPGLLITCVLFFIGTVAASFLPLLIAFNDAKVRVLSVLGAGLLLGAALQVIVPEGFEAFYSEESREEHGGDDPPGWLAGLSLLLGFVTMAVVDQIQEASSGCRLLPGSLPGSLLPHQHQHPQHGSSRRGGSGGSGGSGVSDSCGVADGGEGGGGGGEGGCRQLDTSALLGAGASSHMLGCPIGGPCSPSNTVSALVIHAAADGLALGVAAAGASASLEVVVAAALVFHKAPVAVGLASYLMQARYPLPSTKRALLLFSAATPVAALATYCAVKLLPLLKSTTGVAACLLFSGGSVMYAAAVHILPQALPLGPEGGARRWLHLAMFVCAALLPLLLHALPDA